MTKKEYALKYAEAGLPIFPLHWIKQDGSCSCRLGAMCDGKGKHPLIKNWGEESSGDASKIGAWWTKWPLANIGLPMGEKSGLVALDVDTRHDGEASLAALVAEFGELPDTISATTGGGGKHYLFKYTDKLALKNVVNFRQGLDIRTQGGLIVVAPSIHASGNAYKWDKDRSVWQLAAADMPEWLIAEIQKTGTAVITKKKVAKPEKRVIAEGGRNNYLTQLAGSLRRKGVSEEGILSTLVAENNAQCKPPLENEIVKKIAQSVARYEPESAENEFKMTDVGNAERFRAMFFGEVKYCGVYKKWFIWNGQRWEKDENGRIVNYAIEAVRSIMVYADMLPDGDKRKELIKHSLRSESNGKLRALLEVAMGFDGIFVSPDELDENIWLLNAQNGTINLKTGELQPHSAKDNITKICKSGIDKTCATPLWNSLLSKITNGDELLQRYLQKAVGCALSGDISEQVIFILYGKGSNGKSTFLNIIGNLLQEYAQNTPSETFMQKRTDAVSNDVARLKGARFVTAIEVDEGKRLAEGLIKSMTGGDKLTTRFLYGEFFDYLPQFKVFLACNHRPVIRDTTHSIWRRIKLLPFEATISDHERDKHLYNKIIKSELPGILQWAVDGCLLWQKEGLAMPDTVTKATDEYRTEMDSFGAFMEEICVADSGAKVANKVLRASYDEWCNENGEYVLPQRAFSAKMLERGFTNSRGGANGSRVWHGIRIKGNATPL